MRAGGGLTVLGSRENAIARVRSNAARSQQERLHDVRRVLTPVHPGTRRRRVAHRAAHAPVQRHEAARAPGRTRSTSRRTCALCHRDERRTSGLTAGGTTSRTTTGSGTTPSTSRGHAVTGPSASTGTRSSMPWSRTVSCNGCTGGNRSRQLRGHCCRPRPPEPIPARLTCSSTPGRLAGPHSGLSSPCGFRR